MALTNKLTSLADAIREKTGGTSPLTIDQMTSEISNLQVGGGVDSELVDAIINRTITEIKSDVSIVGDHVFYTCKELVSAEFPNATKINANALRDCIRLVSVSIPNAKDLMGSSFRGDQNIKKLDLPKVEKLYTNVFTGCTRLETIIFRANKVCSMSNDNILSDTPIADGTGYVYVPSALVDSYKTATNWSTYADQIRAIEDYPEITGG